MRSAHFKASYFKWTPNNKTLKFRSVPSVFKWSSDAPKRKSPKKRSFIESTNVAAEIRCSDKDSSDTDDAPETDVMMKIQRLEEEV